MHQEKWLQDGFIHGNPGLLTCVEVGNDVVASHFPSASSPFPLMSLERLKSLDFHGP